MILKRVQIRCPCGRLPWHSELQNSLSENLQGSRIAGQKVDYLVSALKAYRAGQRSHPSMKAVAGSMTDQDIADIAAYYASLN